MPGRPAVSPRPPLTRPAPRRPGPGAVVTAAAALLVAAALAAAQPPTAPTPPEPAAPLIPPEPTSGRPRHRIPDPDRFDFAQIRDNTPFDVATDTAREAVAAADVIRYAAATPVAELEQDAYRDFTYDDFLDADTRRENRLALVGFEGTLLKVRAVRPAGPVAEQHRGPLYHGWLVPHGEPESRRLAVLLTELPGGDFPAPPADGRYADVNRAVSFAGFFFKVYDYAGPGADPADPARGGWLRAPLLIGRGVTPRPGPPPVGVELDPRLRVFDPRHVRDDAPLAQAAGTLEAAARDRVLLHARAVPADDLARAARRDVGPADLFLEQRANHRLKPIHLAGRLKWLRAVPGGDRLKAAGVDTVYEGGLVPDGDRAGNPVTVLFTELPDGLEPQPAGAGMMDRWVTFDGYFFKLGRYTTRERNADGNPVVRRAPVLIGRTVAPGPDPAAVTTAWWGQFGTAVGAGLGALVAAGLAVAWWFRRGDRASRRAVDAVRRRNPFAAPDPPA